MKKDKRLIPQGSYCYKKIKELKNGKYKLLGICPYWSERKDKPEHENGYCSYLEKGDWDLNKEKKWRKVTIKNGKEIQGKWESAFDVGLPMSLIWDMVKECGINEEEQK